MGLSRKSCRIASLVVTFNLIFLLFLSWHLHHLILQGESTCKDGNIATLQNLPLIYVVTPTYSRPTQKADLTRLCHTFLLVPSLHWIIVEDAPQTSGLVKNLLLESTIQSTLLYAQTPQRYKLGSADPQWKKPRGVFQRNHALDWLKSKVPNSNSVVYFADDDNTYDLKLFYEMRFTKMVSVWPVGLVGGLRWEGPIVSNGKVVSWKTAWKPDRPFPIDMAGFAVNYRLLFTTPKAKFSVNVSRGYQESELLRKLVRQDQLEPKAENCTKVYVWHTRTEKPKFASVSQLQQIGITDNNEIEI